MKKFVKLARAVQVETPVLSAVFFGYFVLLVASVMLVTKSADSLRSDTVTATTEVQVEQQMTN